MSAGFIQRLGAGLGAACPSLVFRPSPIAAPRFEERRTKSGRTVTLLRA
jgi:hypothetical protein